MFFRSGPQGEHRQTKQDKSTCDGLRQVLHPWHVEILADSSYDIYIYTYNYISVDYIYIYILIFNLFYKSVLHAGR